MIIGLILVGSGIGAVSALMALILGQSVWMALLIYTALGVLSVLAGAALLALRAEDDCPDPRQTLHPAPPATRLTPPRPESPALSFHAKAGNTCFRVRNGFSPNVCACS